MGRAAHASPRTRSILGPSAEFAGRLLLSQGRRARQEIFSILSFLILRAWREHYGVPPYGTAVRALQQ